MSEEIKPEQLEAAANTAEAATPGVDFQHVIITFADGRRGVFYGPAVIREIEMKLGSVPRLVSVDFDPPRPIQVPIARNAKEETPSADQKINEKPANDVGA